MAALLLSVTPALVEAAPPIEVPASAHVAAATRPAGTFGMAQDDLSISIDTGAGLTFTIRRKSVEGESRGAGDIVSMRYDGVEFQDTEKGSQINSGFSDLYDRQAPVSIDAQQVDADHGFCCSKAHVKIG
ncbi:rhamnogalacturonan lyase B N-terminal domain-containing protein [Paraburkholderia youngii]|uniref:rhamnogalacturonan lyase B N-terminal domain-containing protein n=1 Tax=Paraburkholderia youngii TaxID=2782701 RepID=UPI003D1F2E8C